VTTAADLIEVIFNALPADEQDDVFTRISELRLRRLAGDESTVARMVRSLRQVAGYVGRTPTVADYRQAQRELTAAGADIEPFNRLYSYFDRSWARAIEALTLSDDTTPRRIEARFRYRKLAKIWRYTEDSLRTALQRCAEDLGGRAPMVAEFEHWRQRELELARARGDDTLHLPSATPYRKRWGTWEAALVHFGFDNDQRARRLDGSA
jgi:hypothetical protein